jgi:hypothetical protein
MIVSRFYVVIIIFLWPGNFLQAVNQDLYLFNDTTVIQKAKEIKKTLLFHNRIEKTLQVVSIVANLWSIFKVANQFFQGVNDSKILVEGEALKSRQDVSIERESTYATLRAVPGHFLSSLVAIPTDFITVILNGDLFKSMGVLLGHCILISITNFAIESSLNKVAHRHTIGWYVQTHATYQQTISLCTKQIDSYEQMLLKNDHKVFIEYDIMIGMCNLLLKDLERITAYMDFRIPTIEKRYQKDALAIKILLLNYVFDWRLQVQEILFVEKNISKLKLLLEQCCNEVDRMYKMFSLYEKHLKYSSIL